VINLVYDSRNNDPVCGPNNGFFYYLDVDRYRSWYDNQLIPELFQSTPDGDRPMEKGTFEVTLAEAHGETTTTALQSQPRPNWTRVRLTTS